MLQGDHVLQHNEALRLEIVNSSLAYLVGESHSQAISGRHLLAVLQAVNGRRTVDEVMEASGLHPVHVLEAIDSLHTDGLIVTHREPSARARPAAPQRSSRRAPSKTSTRLALTAVDGMQIPEPLLVELDRLGATVDPTAETVLLLTSDYLDPQLSALSEQLTRNRQRWLLAKPVGRSLLLGPFFDPEMSGPCPQCLHQWIADNRPVEQMLYRAGSVRPLPPQPVATATLQHACRLIAREAVRRCSPGKRAPHDATVFELQLDTGAEKQHTVLRRPQCAACGSPEAMQKLGNSPLRLSERSFLRGADGGFRVVEPSQTYDQYSKLISPLTGAVMHVQRQSTAAAQALGTATAPDRPSHSHVFVSAHRLTPHHPESDGDRFQRVCGGKGRTIAQARTSALCEALERYSGVYRGDEAVIHASFADIEGRALHPDDLQGFSEAQMNCPKPVGRALAQDWTPQRFDESASIAWTPAWPLGEGPCRLVPLACVYSNMPEQREAAWLQYNPNGAAAGNCLEEAILQGLLELVERDAVALWWYNRIVRPAFDLETLSDCYASRLVEEYASLGWKVWALDLTNDLQLPTVVALSHHPEQDRFAIGFGCHIDPALAVQRALTELNQMFAPALKRRAPWAIDAMQSRAYLFPDPKVPARPLPHSSAKPDNLLQALHLCEARLANAGIDTLVVNKTRPHIGLSVAHVIAPGLRHFWPRFGPGRLYDVPAKLGWLSHPLRESELNPVHLFV